MTLRALSLGYSSDPTKYGQEGCARLINCYAVNTGTNAKYPFTVYGADGCTEWADSGITGAIRALFPFENVLLAVAGRSILSFDGTGSATVVGGVAADGPVYVARNRQSPNAEVGFVSDGVFKVYQAGVITDVENENLGAPISLAALDGYFLLLQRDGQIKYTEIDQATELDGLSFFTAESNPDIGIRNVVRGRDHITFGAVSIEFHANTGGADNPFTRTTTRDMGCYAAGSVSVLTVSRREGTSVDTVFFAATDNQGAPAGVHMLSGYDPVKISGKDLDAKIAASDPDDIDSFSYTKDGQAFYQISGSDWTYVYNFSTGFWHELETYNLGRHRGADYAYFAGKHLIGDYADGKLYELSSSVYTDGGLNLVARIQLPPVHGFPKRLRWDEVMVDAVVGVGEVLESDHIANPEMMFDYSEDGGKTWSAERREAMGAAGQVYANISFNRLGLAPMAGRTPRISISAPVKRCIQGVFAELTIAG